MKILYNISTLALLLFIVASCQKGIDPISKVDPGPDTAAPVVSISYPIEGTKIRVDEAVTSMTVKFVASDDIEIQSISIKMDGVEINSYNSFKDYRRAMEEFVYNNVTNGEHALSVIATDLAGKSTTKTVNFKKIAAYVPLNDEVLYLPFDGDYFELVGKKFVTIVGTPGFAAGKVEQAYAGATDSYLTYPATGLLGNEFSLSFWYKLNGTPLRGGIFAIARPYTVYNDTTRFKGFRLARENNGTTKQNLFVNLGTGTAEVWINPFTTLTVPSDPWIHIAVSVSGTNATIYVNGTVAKTAALTKPIDWTGCELISIGSGKPNFSYWDHFSDLSLLDELHMFKRAISADEVTALYTVKK